MPQPCYPGLKDVIGFDLSFPQEYLRAALIISFISVWVLVGLFYYLNRYTRRRYFSIWAAAWLFYALWLTLNISLPHAPPAPWLVFLEQWCIGVAAVFLLWGGARFLGLRVRQFQLALFMAFLLVWSYVGAYEFESALQARLPIFGLIGLASLLTSVSFYRYRRRRAFAGAGLLAAGFALWGLHLLLNPFFQLSEQFASTGFVLSAVLQLFIAVSMIILVLEEVRSTNQATLERLHAQRTQADSLRRQADLSEERCRILFEQAAEGIVIAAADNLDILQLNRTARRMFGLDETTDSPGSLKVHFPSVGGQDNAEWFASLCAQQRWQLQRNDGLVVPVKVDGTPIRFEGRAAYQFFLRELTESARLEQRLRGAEQLAALGRLAGGTARELGGPLGTLQEALSRLRKDSALPPATRAELDRLAAEADRAARLAGKLQTMAGRGATRREPTDLNSVLRRVLDARLLDFRAARLQIEEDFAPELPLIHADPELVRQAFDSMLHVLAASPGGQPGPTRVRISTSASEGMVRALFEDDGPGLPQELAASLADPFFAPKDAGEGAGGTFLSAHSLVSEHQGRLGVRPSSLGGTAFLLELPAANTPAQEKPARPARASAKERKPGARILILDDDVAIAALLGEMLGLLGHRTVIRINGITALEYLGREAVDVILCDFWMPDMDGREFYSELEKRRPDLAGRVVFLTGDPTSPDVKEVLTRTGNTYLAKPFQLDSIGKTVASVVARFGTA